MGRPVAETVRLPMKVLQGLYDVSVRLASMCETLEVLMDKQTMRRVRAGETQYSRRQRVLANGPAEIQKALSS